MPNIHLFVSLLLVTTISHAALHCPHGWTEFQRSCYKVMQEIEHSKIFGGWLKASRACMGYGGYLVSMTSETEKEFVHNLSSSKSAWIGLVHRLPKRIYSWSDGSSFNHSLSVEWYGNTTSKLNGNETKCVELLRDGCWNLTECCNKTEYYICERPKGPLSCPRDHDEGHLNGLSCYYKHSTSKKTWEEAKKDCTASGSNLVKINSTVNKTDTGFLTRLLDTTNFKEDIWIDPEGTNPKKCFINPKKDDGKTNRDCGQSHAYLCEKPVPGKVCHCQSPGKMSSVPTEVNCSFPDSLCFKYSNKSVKDGQFTAQGCISAELCRKLDNQKGLECCHGDLCNTAISCHRCENSSSLDKCQENQDDVDCPIPVHYCAKIKYESTTEGKIQTTYRKGCVTKDQCTANATSGSIVDCCKGDKCNTNSGPRCYECTDPVNFEECAEGRCIFNDGKCYYSGEQQDPFLYNKYGCIQPQYCNIANDGNVIHCCEGSLCNKVTKPRSITVIYLSVGAALAVLLLGAAIFIWCYRRRRKKEAYGSYLSQRSINPLDGWEILREQIEYDGELGRGAFGVVYKAMLWERVGIEVFSTEISKRKLLSSKTEPQVVAVKVLLDNPSAAQKDEFQFEIEQMKQLGSHPNVVSLVGCCTLQDEKFLVIEYVPFGDLLTWLRCRRNRIYACQTSKKIYDDKVGLKDDGNAKNQVQDKEEEKQVSTEFTPLVQDDNGDKMDKMLCENDKGFKTISDKQPTVHSAPMENQHVPALLASTESLAEDLTDDEVSFSTDKNIFLFAQEMEKGKKSKDAKRRVEKEQTQMNMEMTPLLQDDGDVIREDAQMTSENLHDDKGLEESTKEQLNMSNNPPVESQHTESKPPSSENLEEDPHYEEESFSTRQLFKFAWQIARGMNHLAEKNLVHRDLAARNVLVGHDNRVKVSDFGLMRQIYEDVKSSEKSKKLPVKWMAPESLYQGTFTIKSDVWSYGVLLWEMATLGGVPYPTLTNTELYRLLSSGYRMEKPDMSSDEVYQLMTECWKEDPRARPSFYQMIEKLEIIMQKDAPYLDVNKHNEAHPYYNVPPHLE